MFFTFIHMKIIKIGKYDFKWFFTIAKHDELKKIDPNIFTKFFLQNR